eukprot:gb/GFBE01082168.1/.p1 GENE.gb/GFBE01082168.1/~~gb/GFBE01082168.1/.p1  ORF type:complete len:116 (+),score=4.17 gb/GFBE01082168.1/:1-348(+)
MFLCEWASLQGEQQQQQRRTTTSSVDVAVSHFLGGWGLCGRAPPTIFSMLCVAGPRAIERLIRFWQTSLLMTCSPLFFDPNGRSSAPPRAQSSVNLARREKHPHPLNHTLAIMLT